MTILNSRLRAPRRTAGFTLIELMVVIVILGLLVTIVGPNVQKFMERGRIQTAKTQMANLQQACETYRLEKGRLPESLDEVKENLQQETVPKDPWGNEYRYVKLSKKKYDIICYGEGGEEGGEETTAEKDIHLEDLLKSAADSK